MKVANMKKIIFSIVFVLLFSQTFSQNLSWKAVNADVGVNITSIMQDSTNRIVLLSEKGLFFLTNLTQVERIDSFLPDSIKISCFAINTKNELYAGTFKNGVFFFDEKNKKWVNISSKLGNQNIKNIAINSKNKIVVGTTMRNLYFFNMPDSSWTRIKGFQDNLDFSFVKFSCDDELFAGWAGYLYKLIKDYINEDDLRDLPVGCIDVDNVSSYNQKNYVSTEKCNIFYSEDSSKTWIKLYEGLEGVLNISDVLITRNEELIVISRTKGVFYSNNVRTNFEENNSGLTNLNVISGCVMNDGRILINSDSIGLFVSDAPKNNPIKPVGWSDSVKYLERKALSRSVDFIKFSNDGTKIFTIGGSEYKIWDVKTGYLLKQHRFSTDVLINANISDDDSTIIINCEYYSSKYSLCSFIYSMNNDSLIKQFYCVQDLDKCMGTDHNYSIRSIKTDYSHKDKILDCSYDFGRSCDGSTIFYNNYGGLLRVDFISDSIKSTELYNHPVTDFIKTKSEKLFITSDEYADSFSNWSNPKNHWNWSSTLEYIDINLKEKLVLSKGTNIDGKTDNYNPLSSMKYLENKNRLVTLRSANQLFFWDLISKKPVDSCFFTQTPVDYAFSRNELRIVAGFNTGIYILSSPEMRVLDSIPFHYETGYKWKIAVSPDSNTFVFGSYDGMIRLVKSDWLNNTLGTDIKQEPDLDKQQYLISPNPATDFIEISVGAQGTVPNIRIFNVFGENVKNPSPSLPKGEGLRIDVSGLPSGVYFVRVGDKVGKFVKI